MHNDTKPHDTFMKALLSEKSRARAFLRHMLPAGLMNQLDLDTLEPEDRLQLPESGHEHYVDALFRVRMRSSYQEEEALVSILLEHKSYADKWVGLQLLYYIGAAYYARHNTHQPLQLVIPYVFCHGVGSWSFQSPRELMGERYSDHLRYVPSFEVLTTDLSNISEEFIENLPEPWLRASLLVQKYSRRPGELLHRFGQIFSSLPGPEEGNFFEVLVVYYLKLVPIGREQFQAMVAALPSVKKPEVMMLYDAILEEGREKGLREGLEKGLEKGLEEAKKRTILNGHKNGLSVDMLCLLTDYREEDVLRILAQIDDQTPD